MRAFSPEVYAERTERVRKEMQKQKFDACIITSPESIYWLTGLNHQGYFAYTSLILSLEKQPVLITRAMEKAIVRDMVPELRHWPFPDEIEPLPEPLDRERDVALSLESETEEPAGLNPWSMSLGVSIRDQQGKTKDFSAPVETTCQVLKEYKLDKARVAFEQDTSFLSYKIAHGFVSKMPDVEWLDAGDLVTGCRVVQTPQEIEYTRKAAEISDAMVMAGTAMAGPGVFKKDVMAAIYQAMFQRGGTYPGFIPLIRSTRTIEHEHGTWDDEILQDEDLLFLEMSGCHWRYHAPVGRLVTIHRTNDQLEATNKICLEAHMAAADALKPGVTSDSVYRSWKKVVDDAGLTHYHRHHCGYAVGIGFPPSWSGSGVPRGLRKGSDMVVQQGMVFHLMSWLLRTGQGDAFLSDTVVVTETGCEFLTNAPRDILIR